MTFKASSRSLAKTDHAWSDITVLFYIILCLCTVTEPLVLNCLKIRSLQDPEVVCE